MTDDYEFDAKLGKVAKALVELGLTIRAGALPALTERVFATGSPMTASELSLAVRKHHPALAAAQASETAKLRKMTPEQKLELGNERAAAAAKAAPPKVEQKTPLSPSERERLTRWGPGSLLERANEGVPFVTEANDDE